MKNLEELLTDAVLALLRSDSKFKMVVHSEPRGTWDVVETHYVDQDRGGWCGYSDTTILSDIEQMEASSLVNHLNAMSERSLA